MSGVWPPVVETREHISPKVFERFRRLVYDQSGITLGDNKQALLAARVAKRMRELGLEQHEQYLEWVESDQSGDELIQMLDAISTNVTSFYRESAHFEQLRELARQWQSEGRRRIRLWCAASSTGEEPYTIAMTLADALGQSGTDWKLLATDISTRVLRHAMRGVYDEERVKPVPAELRQRYGRTVDLDGRRGWEVDSMLRQRVIFRRLNLSQPPFPLRGPLDAVFCRNVMIYFDTETRERLIGEIYRLLRPGGYLFVGHAEALSGLRTKLRSIRPSVYVRDHA